jgi:hypothetical protein
MSYMFRPQTCRFVLYTPFNEIINSHLQNLAFDPINGVLLTFENSSDRQRQSVTVEIDPEGNVSKVSMIDPKTLSADVIFDFSNDEFIHFGESSLDLICGHPLFHMLQQTFVAHYQNGDYSVTIIAL